MSRAHDHEFAVRRLVGARHVSGAVLRGFMVGVIVLLLSLFFTKIHLYHPLVTLSTFVLAAVIFALLGFINAIFARKFDDIAIIPTFILTPLTYLGGVFYNVARKGQAVAGGKSRT